MADILIIGGGIIGMLTARELHSSGASVMLLEKGETGRESTWAGGGILSPLYPWRYSDAVTRLANWSQSIYPELALTLEEETGISPQWSGNGLLILDPQEQAQAVQWAQRHQLSLELVSAEQIAELEPALAPPPEQAVWMPQVGQVRNPRLAQALKQDLLQRGIGLRQHCAVEAIAHQGGRAQGVHTAEGTLLADQVVVCAGAWSGKLLQNESLPVEITPAHGQMILFHAAPGLLKRITLFQDRYTIPRRDGRVLMGSTLEDTGFNKIISGEVGEELAEIARQRFPALRSIPVEHHWSGLRPASPHGVPYIGEHPQIQGLFINSGHFRNGVILGPASCRLVADLVLKRPPIFDPQPYGLLATRP